MWATLMRSLYVRNVTDAVAGTEKEHVSQGNNNRVIKNVFDCFAIVRILLTRNFDGGRRLQVEIAREHRRLPGRCWQLVQVQYTAEHFLENH